MKPPAHPMRISMLPRSTLQTLCLKMTAREAILCALSIALLLLAGTHVASTDTSSSTPSLLSDTSRKEAAAGTTSSSHHQGCCTRNTSSEESDTMQQHNRFIAVRKGRTVNILCGCWSMQFPAQRNVSWYRGHQDGSVITYLNLEPHMTTNGISLIIKNVQRKDTGIYFCTYNTTQKIKQPHCGTELMVVGCANAEITKSRNTMKDTIIVIQTILIALFIVVPVTLLRGMNKKRNLKIEDHTYEGLEAYQTATYEDIQTVRVLAAKTMEGEHPCLE